MQHHFDTCGKFSGTLVVPHYEQHRIISRQGTDEEGDIHAVKCGGSTVGKTRHGVDHHQILREINIHYTLPENVLQLVRYMDFCPVVGHGIAILSLPCRCFNKMQLLNIPGYCSLRTGKAPGLQ